MGRDYNNDCRITGNFCQGVRDKYGDYFWENLPCSTNIKIFEFMLELLKEDGYYPLTEADLEAKETIGNNWWYGQGDTILAKSATDKFIMGRYFYVSYAETLAFFLKEANRCDSSSCNCWHDDQNDEYPDITKIWEILNGIKKTRETTKKEYWTIEV